MAVQEMLWKSKHGKHFKTEKEADRDDEIIEAKQFRYNIAVLWY